MRVTLPKSIVCLREYNLRTFFADLTAGLTVGLIALPLAMAFAISSGMPPQSGLYCAVITGFLISALGGSRNQIGGPTGAFVVVVCGIVAQHGVDGLFICTMMAGVILIILGATGLGSAVKFMPRPVIIGFTNGIAVLVASAQIKDFFGLEIDKAPGEFLSGMESVVSHFHTLSLASTLLAACLLGVIVICTGYVKKLPGPIVAMVLGAVAVAVLGLPVATIGTRFGGVPSGLPALAIPQIDLARMLTLVSPAMTIAMLAAIESLLSAVVADRMSGDKHDPNVELVAHGVANLASPLFGGLPATGAIARTATNIRSGAKTPMAGMIHAITLLGILLFAAPLGQFVPLAALSAILLVVAYRMGEWHEVPKLFKLTWADISVWLLTFLLTVFANLTLAVEVGLVLSALFYIRRVTRTTTVAKVTTKFLEDGRHHTLHDKTIPEFVTIIHIQGPFLFGASEKLAAVADHIEELAPVVILRLRHMTAIDATGLLTLEDFANTVHAANRTLILCGAGPQPAKMMRRAEFEQHIGGENICPNINAALERAALVFSSTTPIRRSA